MEIAFVVLMEEFMRKGDGLRSVARRRMEQDDSIGYSTEMLTFLSVGLSWIIVHRYSNNEGGNLLLLGIQDLPWKGTYLALHYVNQVC